MTIPPTGPAFARAVLDAAAQVEAAEVRIRHELRRAAQARDIPRILDILERWANQPALEVQHALGLDPCGKPEVQDERRSQNGV
jgi:hypothetical protein